MFRRIADSALFALSMIAVLLAASWPPAGIRAAVSPPPQPNTATQPPVQPAATTHLYLPFMRTSIGAPQFLISNPAAGSTIAGTSLVVAQPILGPSVSSVKFTAGNKTLGIDNTPADGFQAFIDAKQFPAGALKITATATGPEGGQAKSVDVTVQPSPPSSATVGASGTTLGTASGATIVIPPGAVSGNANVSLRERNQAQVTAESGIKWDDIGVTFLGDIQVQSSTPLQKPVDISTVGYSNRVQPGQTVVTYNMLPDQDGDGVGELVVASGATVAPNGAIVSTPSTQITINSVSVIARGVIQSKVEVSSQRFILTQSAPLTGASGNLLSIQGSGFNANSIGGNLAQFQSLVDGKTFTYPGMVIENGTNSTFNATIPPLVPGAATLSITNQSTGEVSLPISIHINSPPSLSQTPSLIIDRFLNDSISYVNSIPADSPAAIHRPQLLKQLNSLKGVMPTLYKDPHPAVQQMLVDTAGTMQNFVLNAELLNDIQPEQVSTGTILTFAGIAVGLTLLVAVGGVLVLNAAALGLLPATVEAIGAAIVYGRLASAISGAIAFGLGLWNYLCTPTASGNSTSRGVGGAPPPGGNGCGNVSGSSGSNNTTSISSRATTSSLAPGRYIIKVFPQAGGKALSPFTGATDAGGYFFLPFIPKGEPFRAVAVDTVTGASQTFDGVGPDVGKSVYMFFDFSNAQSNNFPINIGDTISDGAPRAGAGNIENPGALDIYTFTAEADRQVSFDLLTSAAGLSNTKWKLTNAVGTVVFNRTLGDTGVVTLPGAGTYTLTVGDDNSGGTGTYSFKLIGIPLPNRFTIAVGDTVSPGVPGPGAGNIETSYVKDIYTFSATAGQQVFFDLQNPAAALAQLNWRLLDPDGVVLFNTIFNCCGGSDPGVFTLAKAGTYTIIVGEDAEPSTGTYGFKLWNVPAPQQFAITIGATVSPGVPGPGAGNIETPGVKDIYTFTGTVGQQVFLDLQNPAAALAQLNWRLLDPDGVVLFNTIFNCCGGSDPGVFTLAKAGTYTIIVGEDTEQSTGTYGFKLWNVPAPQQFAITIGATVSPGVPGPGAGNIETPGVKDIYTFTGTVGQQVFLDLQNPAAALAQLNWRLLDPDGVVLFNTIFNCCGGSDPGVFTLSKAGTYTIIVGEDTEQSTGTYGFKLWNVPAPQQFAIAIGATVSPGVPGPGAGNIETPGVKDIYTFTATAGQQVFFDLQNPAATLAQLNWRLLDPDSIVLFNTIFNCCGGSDPGAFTLSKSGTYTIIVGEDTEQSTGTYGFQVRLQ